MNGLKKEKYQVREQQPRDDLNTKKEVNQKNLFSKGDPQQSEEIL